jgi:hypothetical protein
MPVTVQPNQTLRCTCGAKRSMGRHTDPLSACIAAEQFEREHFCTLPEQQPKQRPAKETAQHDRWSSLFAGVSAELNAI